MKLLEYSGVVFDSSVTGSTVSPSSSTSSTVIKIGSGIRHNVGGKEASADVGRDLVVPNWSVSGVRDEKADWARDVFPSAWKHIVLYYVLGYLWLSTVNRLLVFEYLSITSFHPDGSGAFQL